MSTTATLHPSLGVDPEQLEADLGAAGANAPIGSESEADEVLLRIARLERNRGTLKAEADRELEQIREEYRGSVEPINAAIKNYKRQLRTWGKKQLKRWEKQGRKSLELTHGKVAFRTTQTKLELPKDEAALLERIKELGLGDTCIHRYEKPNLQELENHDAATLEALGIKRKGGGQTFVIELRHLTEPVARLDAGGAS